MVDNIFFITNSNFYDLIYLVQATELFVTRKDISLFSFYIIFTQKRGYIRKETNSDQLLEKTRSKRDTIPTVIKLLCRTLSAETFYLLTILLLTALYLINKEIKNLTRSF